MLSAGIQTIAARQEPSVELAAQLLAVLMQKLLGGEWRVNIDYEAEFVIVTRRRR